MAGKTESIILEIGLCFEYGIFHGWTGVRETQIFK